MGGVLDSFVVEFGLDPTKFTEGQKKLMDQVDKTRESVNRGGRDIEAAGKKGAGGFDLMSGSALKYFGILAGFVGLGSIKQLVEQTAAAEVQTGRLATTMGISTEKLSLWEGVVERSGGKASDAQAAFKAFADALYDIQVKGDGGNPDIGILGRLGIDVSELKDGNELLLKLSDASQRFKDRPAEFTNLMHDMGLTDPMIQLLMKGRPAVEAELSKQRGIGFITDEDVKNGQQFAESMAEIKQATASIGREFVHDINPSLKQFADGWVKLATDPRVRSFMQAVGDSLAGKKNMIAWGPEPKKAPPAPVGNDEYSRSMVEGFDEPGQTAPPLTGSTRAHAGFLALVGSESNGNQFNPKTGLPLTSSMGAIGAAQVMPGTAPQAARLAGLEWDPKRYRNDKAYNLALGKAYFNMLYKKYGGDLSQAWAAYNAGPGTVDNAILDAHAAHRDGHWGDYMENHQWPNNAKQTRDYVAKNMRRFNSASAGGVGTINITVNTAATDAQGTAKAVAGKLKPYLFDTGMR